MTLFTRSEFKMTTLKCPRPSLLFSYYIILITSVLYLLLLYFIQHDSAPGYWEVWRSLCSNTTSPCNMGNPISGNSLSNYSYLYNVNISFQHPEIPYFIIISEKEQEVAAAAVIVPTVARCVQIESPCRRRVPCIFYFRDGKLVQKNTTSWSTCIRRGSSWCRARAPLQTPSRHRSCFCSSLPVSKSTCSSMVVGIAKYLLEFLNIAVFRIS